MGNIFDTRGVKFAPSKLISELFYLFNNPFNFCPYNMTTGHYNYNYEKENI